MGFPIRVMMFEERPPEATVRQWRDLLKASHADMGQHWHQKMLPRHFEPGARERYGYKPRTRKYAIRKNRDYTRGKATAASNVDLVYTGFLRRSLSTVATIRAFPTRVTIQMTGPRYVTMRVHNSNQPDKAAEVTAVTRDEADELSALLAEGVTRRLDALRAPTQTLS